MKKEHVVRTLRAKFDEAVAIHEQVFESGFGFSVHHISTSAQTPIKRCSSAESAPRPAAMGYAVTRKPELEPWQPDYPGRPFREPPGILEIPTREDLTIRGVPPGDREVILKLFKREIPPIT